jgi:thiol-disulfide isomerase/thioredoxin
MRRARRAAGAAAVGLVLVAGLAACGDGGVPVPGAAKVDVDTPELRAAKEAAGVEDCVPGTGDPVEGGLPEVTLPCFGGGPDVDLAALRGPLVVNLWASWCGPCRKEMPEIQAFFEQHGDRVPVLGIDWEDPQVDAAMQLVTDTGVTYPLVADPGGDVAVVDDMVIKGLPGIVLVDEDGTVVYRALEVIESPQQLEDLVTEHLGVDL